MRSTHNALVLSVAVLWGVFAPGCAASLCQTGEPSVNCCVKKFPLTPEQSCGVPAAEATALLKAMDRRGLAGALRETYVQCRGQKKPRWVGDCHACFRYCEGQRQWPFDLCHPKRR
jgi:hypothetical protein